MAGKLFAGLMIVLFSAGIAFADMVADPKDIARAAKELEKKPPTEQALGVPIYPKAKLDAESSAKQTLVRKGYYEVYVYKVKDTRDNVVRFYKGHGGKYSDGQILLENDSFKGFIGIRGYNGDVEEISIWKKVKK